MLKTHVESDMSSIISSLYQSILKREADPSGLKGYLDSTKSMSIAEAVRHTSLSLLNSKEFSRDQRNKIISDEIGNELKNIYPQILSLGTHCQTSFVLKKYGLKKFSGPFDWLFSSPEMIAHCINDRFETLLNQKFYKVILEREQAQHLFYLENFGVDSVFAHLNPLRPEKYAYLERCVKRFHEALNRNEPTLMIATSRPRLDLTGGFEKIVDALKPWPHARVVGVQLRENSGSISTTYSRPCTSIGHHVLFEFQPMSKELGASWPNPEDDVRFLRIIQEASSASRFIEAK